MKISKFAVLTALSLGLIACGGDGAPAGPNTGALSISITDAPITGATAVVVEFTGIELQGPGGRTDIGFGTDTDTAKSINLLDYQGSLSTPLAEKSDMPAGNYQWMRLKVNALQNTIDSYIEFENGMEQYSLYVPSGAESGLKLNRPFVIAAGGRTDFTIDFDLNKSVHLPSNANADYKLRPTLRIVDNLEVGTITGTVSVTTLSNNDCTPDNAAVYLFDGLDADPVDIDLLNAEPVTTAAVQFSDPATGSYEIGFVQAGMDYTVALTCDADLDIPDVDNSAAAAAANDSVDEVFFIIKDNVSVVANSDNIVDEF